MSALSCKQTVTPHHTLMNFTAVKTFERGISCKATHTIDTPFSLNASGSLVDVMFPARLCV